MCRGASAFLIVVNVAILPFISSPASGFREGKEADNLAFNPELRQAWRDLIYLDLAACRQRCRPYIERESPDPAALYLDHLALCAGMLTDDPSTDYEGFKTLEEQWLRKAGSLPAETPFQLFLVSEIRLRGALVRLKYGENTSAFWNFRQAYLLARKNNGKFPEFTPSLKTLGLLEIAFGNSPDQYHWMLRLLGIQPDAASGVERLQKASLANDPLGMESQLLIALAQAYLIGDTRGSEKTLGQLLAKFPDSALLCYVYGSVALKNSESEKALVRMPARGDAAYLRLPPLHYLLGEIYLQKQDYDASISEYGKFLALHRGKNLIKDAHFKTAMAYWLSGRENEARKVLAVAAVSGEQRAEVDINADYSIRSGKLPNPDLLRVRYSTDGGYYPAAAFVLEGLDQTAFSNDEERTEYQYRLGRLRHKQWRIAEAITSYQRTVELQGSNSWYYAPNACLQLGDLYRQSGDTEKSLQFYKLAASYKDHPYSVSIRNKARHAMNAMKQ